MKKETSTTVYTCDFCGEECEPIRELKLLHSFAGDGRNEIILIIKPQIYYGTNNGDICEKCLNEVFENYKERIQK